MGFVVVIGFAAVVLMGQATLRKRPRVLEAEEFVLVDANGGVRGALTLGPHGVPSLSLFGEGGNATLMAGGEPALTLIIKDGKGGIALGVGAEGSPGLGFLDKDGKLRVTLGSVLVGGVPTAIDSLVLHDKGGKVIWKAP